MDLKKERYRRIRGAILRLLAYEHPKPVDSKVIHLLLDDLKYSITEEECQSHICYLTEKGFVNMELRKSSGIRLEMITVSPAGLDLLDGFIQDVGVDTRI